MAKLSKKPLVAALGAAFIATSVVPFATADTNPFGATQLDSGYDLANYNDPEGKHAEGTCAGKKGMEGSCGGDKGQHDKTKGAHGGTHTGHPPVKGMEGSCGGNKTKEGTCGGAR